MKRPASQWYWADWLRDPAIRASSLESRGLWMDMLALMHEGTPYGHLTVGGEAVTDLQLSRMVGETPARVRKLLKELEAHGVFSRTDSGVMFSRRMVRDEHIRNVRAEAGKLGGNPNLNTPPVDNPRVNRLDKQKVKQKPTPSSSSSSASPEQPLRGGWVARFGAPYSESSGGIAPLGEIGRHCKPLVDRDGEDPTYARWVNFCVSDKRQFGAAYFAKNAGDFDPAKKPKLIGVGKDPTPEELRSAGIYLS